MGDKRDHDAAGGAEGGMAEATAAGRGRATGSTVFPRKRFARMEKRKKARGNAGPADLGG